MCAALAQILKRDSFSKSVGTETPSILCFIPLRKLTPLRSPRSCCLRAHGFALFGLRLREVRTAAWEDARLGGLARAWRCMRLCRLHAVLGLRWSHPQARRMSERVGLAGHLLFQPMSSIRDGVALLLPG